MDKFPLVLTGFVYLLFAANSSMAQGGGKDGSIVFKRPEPADWYTGDIHVHRSCDGSKPIPATDLPGMMKVNHLAVISVLGDMGNNNSADRIEDLQKVNGKDSPLSDSNQVIHYAAEWHWDATQWKFPHQALGGHLVLLGLHNAHKIWDESNYKILDWAATQHAVRGFAHMQYLNNRIQDTLDCCIPIDYPVEAALHNIEFVAEEQSGGSENGILAYYRLLNCGIRLSLAGGTDYPCNRVPLGSVLTYVEVPGKKLTYEKWIEGISKGRTVVSRNAHNEFINLKVNKTQGPGAEIKLNQKGTVTISATWTVTKETSGDVELVSNGKVIAKKSGTAKPGDPVTLTVRQPVSKSAWICARRMDPSGKIHMLHTSPVYVLINEQPIRASTEDALYFVAWIENILKQIAPGGPWNKYFPDHPETVKEHYTRALNIYKTIAKESQTVNK